MNGEKIREDYARSFPGDLRSPALDRIIRNFDN